MSAPAREGGEERGEVGERGEPISTAKFRQLNFRRPNFDGRISTA